MVASRGHPLVKVFWLLTAVASLVAERGLWGVGAQQSGSPALEPQQLWSMGLAASLLVGASPIQGSNPKFLSLLHWQADSLPPSHQIRTGGLPGVCPSRSFSLRGGVVCGGTISPVLVLPPFSPSSPEDPSSTPALGR